MSNPNDVNDLNANDVLNSPEFTTPNEVRDSQYEEEVDPDMGEIDTLPEGKVECEFLTGEAGSGKTFEIKRRIKANPKYAVLAATTGIAAVNLDTTTINSLLKFFDTDSLRESFLIGRLSRYLKYLGIPGIVIDEVSMMDGDQLDIIYKAAMELGKEFRLVLTGDFAQLPPVKAKWAFEAECWGKFDEHTTRLTKNWRQSDPKFLQAINHIRRGDGKSGVDVLQGLMKFWTATDMKFDGTTILSKNIDVDRHNEIALMNLTSKAFMVPSKRWGKSRGEWKNIPETLKVKVGAYVMLLANNWDAENQYVNGDCGHIVDYDAETGSFTVKLVRDNGREVSVRPIVRNNEQKERPDSSIDGDHEAVIYWPEINGRAWRGLYYSGAGKVLRTRWIMGQVKYFPIRLAYASTVHKTQGLSLDKVQIDIRNAFFGEPSMVYVALSRCRTPEGLRIVGTSDTVVKRVNIDEKIKRWL